MEELRVQGLAVSYSPAGTTALVVLHGAGAGTRDSSPLYRHLHETLPPIGVGVATFDRRGEGESEGESRADASRPRRRTRSRSRQRSTSERVGLWGFSQGALGGAARGDAVRRGRLRDHDRGDRRNAGRADDLREPPRARARRLRARGRRAGHGPAARGRRVGARCRPAARSRGRRRRAVVPADIPPSASAEDFTTR